MRATRPASGIKERLTDRYVMSAVCEPLLSYKHCIFPTRDASPPFVVAFDGSVLCLCLVLAFSGSGTFTILQKLYLPSILHLTLTRCNSLIINVLLSVRYYQFYLHKPTRNLHTPHATTRHKHGRKISRHRGTEKSVAPIDCSTSLCRIIHRIRPNRLRGSGVRCVRCMQGCVRYFEIILHS